MDNWLDGQKSGLLDAGKNPAIVHVQTEEK